MIFSTRRTFPAHRGHIGLRNGMEILFNHPDSVANRRLPEMSLSLYLTGICPVFFFFCRIRNHNLDSRTIGSPSWNRSSLANDAGDSENQENVQRRRRAIRGGQTPLTPAFAYRRVTWFLGHAISSPTPLSSDSRICCDLKPLNPSHISWDKSVLRK